MFKKPECIRFNENKGIYAQTGPKFTGYAQYPRSRVNPYFNKRHVLRIDKKKQASIPKKQEDLSITSDRNQHLFDFDPFIKEKGKKRDPVPKFMRTMSTFCKTATSGFADTHLSGFGQHKRDTSMGNTTKPATSGINSMQNTMTSMAPMSKAQSLAQLEAVEIGRIHESRYKKKVFDIDNKKNY